MPGAASSDAVDLELSSRRAVVTGGSRGIGLAVGRALAAEGAAVALVARDAGAVARAAGSLAAPAGQRVVVIAAGLGIAFLLIAGFRLLGDRLTNLGVIALIVALALLIVWVVRESRRFP